MTFHTDGHRLVLREESLPGWRSFCSSKEDAGGLERKHVAGQYVYATCTRGNRQGMGSRLEFDAFFCQDFDVLVAVVVRDRRHGIRDNKLSPADIRVPPTMPQLDQPLLVTKDNSLP